MATCAACAERRYVKIRGVKIDLILFTVLLSALFVGLLSWRRDVSHGYWPVASWAHHTSAYLFSHYLLTAAFFGIWMYLMFAGFIHLPHSGRLWWRALLLLVVKLALAFGALFAVGALLRAWLR